MPGESGGVIDAAIRPATKMPSCRSRRDRTPPARPSALPRAYTMFGLIALMSSTSIPNLVRGPGRKLVRNTSAVW